MCDGCDFPMPRPEDFRTDEAREAFMQYITEYLARPLPYFSQIEHTDNGDGTVTFHVAKEKP